MSWDTLHTQELSYHKDLRDHKDHRGKDSHTHEQVHRWVVVVCTVFVSCCKYGRESGKSQAVVDSLVSGSASLCDLLDSVLRRSGESSALPTSIRIVWHMLRQKSRGSGHLVACHTTYLVDWLVVRMNYSVRYFMMLNAINLCWFVTLTLWHFVTPHERLDWFTTTRECDFFQTNLVSHLFNFSCHRWTH